MNGILLFKLRYIGDVLLTTPAIRLLRRSYPNAHITMVVNKGTEDILRHNPQLNRVLTVEREAGTWRLVRALRERRYDVSVDFVSGDRAAWLAWLAGAPQRIALRSSEGLRRFISNRQVKPPATTVHTVDLYLSFLRERLGLTTDDRAPELHTGTDDETFATELLARYQLPDHGFILAHAGGRYPQNRWPLENWKALVNAAPMKVVFIGAKQDAADAAQTGGLSLVGQTSVLQLAALARRAAVFVGNDSGPMHIAAAMGTRVVALFGPTSDVASWRPWGEGHKVLSISSTVTEVVQSC